MKMYVKKPIPVPALQWTGDNFQEIKDFCTDENLEEMCFTNNKDLWIKTREGQLMAQVGDFIMKGIEGEFYPCAESIFKKTYDEVEETKVDSSASISSLPNYKSFENTMAVKSLHNTDSNGAKKNVKDIQFWGNGDTFKLISKASSENEGFMKSTKAMEIIGVGCVVQTTTQQRNPDGSYSLTDAVTFVPNCGISETKNDEEVVISRKLVKVANY
jgi:hypothetical protein